MYKTDEACMSMAELFSPIEPVPRPWIERAEAHLSRLTKPRGSLGRLEEIATRLVAIQRTDAPSVAKKSIVVFAADHGVCAEGVSAYPSSVTAQMVLNFLAGGAAINVLARCSNAEIHVADVGVNASLADGRLISRKICPGTKNLRREPAMSSEELSAALSAGMSLAEDLCGRGTQLVAVGEMGIGNTTSASAIAAALTAELPQVVTSSGTGVCGEILEHKKKVVEDALALHFPNYRRERPAPLEVLRCVGGLEIAAMTGFALAAARQRLAIVIDGFISTAAAAIACLLAPAASDYLFAGHQSCEAGHRFLLELIGLRPLLNLDMRLGEGTGAVLAFSLIDAAAHLYREMATFSSAGVSEAIPNDVVG
jgi:nicotinate-nucleotide--dimethylbenzimidazole phosphoribosyltransferase